MTVSFLCNLTELLAVVDYSPTGLFRMSAVYSQSPLQRFWQGNICHDREYKPPTAFHITPLIESRVHTTKQNLWLIKVTPGLTLGFQYCKGGSLLSRLHCHSNLCCKPAILWSRLCLRWDIYSYRITAYWLINTLENSILEDELVMCFAKRM